MNGRRSLLLATALVAALGASSATPAPGSGGAAAPGGEIVFVSNRATANPGEIYALAPGSAPRHVSPSPYADLGLATSPKGRAYAFWSYRSGPWRLMISPSGGVPRSVVVGEAAGTDGQYPSFPPVFSPDGTRLLIPYVPLNSRDYRLRFALAAARSGPARPLTIRCLQSPAWSPDGRLLACAGPASDKVSVFDLAGRVRFTAPGTSVFWSADGRLAVAGKVRTAVMSADGRVLARLAGVAHAWSPDGRHLALTNRSGLVVAEPGHGDSLRVAYRNGDGTVYSVAFTPDGRDIAYSGSTVEAILVPVAGGPARPLVAGFGGTWSRDGHYAFAFASNSTVTIKVGDRLGHGARVVARLPFDDHGDFALAWLGDGSRLLYDSSVRDHADLWAMGADGSGQRRLTNNGQRISAPAWSADGTKLAYDAAAFHGGLCGYCGGNVVVADAQGHRLALVPGALPDQESSEGHATWAPSGTQVAVSNDFNGGIYVVGLDGSGRTQVAPDVAASPAWSPDGATVAYSDSFSGGAIWGVDPAGAARRRLLPASSLKATSVAWSPDGRLLAFSTADGVYIAAADGSTAEQRVAPAQTPGRPSFSPDGSWLAFAAQAGSIHPYTAIYEVGADGSGLRQLTTGPFDSADPAWQPQPPR